MRVVFLSTADYANVTHDLKLNVIGLFNEIRVTEFPAVVAEMHLVIRFAIPPSEFGSKRTLTIKLVDQDATEVLMETSAPMEMPSRDLETGGRDVEFNHILRINGMRFTKEGPYQFSVLVDNDEKETFRLDVAKIPPPED